MSTRILSIQSHVSFGYVGGKAAVFPLQCLGYDVDVVNTVNFSNHAAYHRSGGPKTTAAELRTIFEAMESNELLTPSRLLTGYTANAESLDAVRQLVERLRDRSPELVYLLDPVLGDSGRLYVSPDCIPVYRQMLPNATIITPNWFELETLTDIKLTDLPSLRRALRVIHEDYRVPNVVISSIPLSTWLNEALPTHLRPASSAQRVLDSEAEAVRSGDYILCLTSTRESNTSGKTPSLVQAIAVPTVPGYFTGVGDLFSALVLGHYDAPPSLFPDTSNTSTTTPSNSLPTQTAISHAVALALHKTQSLIHLTHEHSVSLPEDEHYPTDDERDEREPRRRTRRMRGRELRVVQGRKVFCASDLEEVGRLRGLQSEVGLGRLRAWEGFWETS